MLRSCVSLVSFFTGVRNGPGQQVGFVMYATGTGPSVRGSLAGHFSLVSESFKGRFCPSSCPSDWDKQKPLVANGCIAAGYEERFLKKRRGQDSLSARLLRMTVCGNSRAGVGLRPPTLIIDVSVFAQCFKPARYKTATRDCG